MRDILFRSGLVTLLSILGSIAIASVFMSGPAGIIDGNGLLLCILCPLIIAWPASAHAMWQKKRLHTALDEVNVAHRDLAAAHTELERVHALLSDKARRDDMTNLFNRETFFKMLDSARARPEGGALLIVDADNFKAINDSHGHLSGDEALLLISGALQKATRDRDIVGRIGGEEFGVFLPRAGNVEAEQVAERIRAEVERLVFRPDGSTGVRLTVSIGGTPSRAGEGLADMMREADRRLYEAKRSGRNMVIWKDGVSEAA